MRRKYTGELADLLKARLMGKTDCAHFMQLCGKNPEAADNPLYGVFGVLKDNDWVIARTLAVEPLHTMEAGVFMQIQLLMVQLPQRLHELAGVPVSAESQAALFADRVIAGSAMSLHTLIAAVPTKLRHSTWVASTVKRHISRAKGLRKPPAVRLEFRYMNAWHYRDLGRSLAVWVLQPDFLGLLLKGPVVRPLWNVRDFFGEWLPFNPPPERAPFGYFVQQTIPVNVSELQLLLAEVWCLLARWNEHFQIDEISTRQLSELRLLDNEFHEAAKAVLAFKATWKKHQMEEAPESRMDLGNQVTANLSESAHKLSKLLYRLVGNRSALGFTQQLARARNHVVAAQVYCRQYELSLQPSNTATDVLPHITSKVSHLRMSSGPQLLLTIEVNERFKVISLQSSCGTAQKNMDMLLHEHGYEHLYWAILNYLAEEPNPTTATLRSLEPRDLPLLTMQIHSSMKVGQSGCTRAAAATVISSTPFSEMPTRAFIAADSEGGEWFGWPLLLATLTTYSGQKQEVVFCKWLDHTITGHERLKLPLPTCFPMHQWQQTQMGLPPLNGRAHLPSETFGIIDVSKVLRWEPIVFIGNRTWRPTSSYVSSMQRGKRVKRAKQAVGMEEPPLGVGQPLFVNNVHVWSFGAAS
jgi:hypothetical protein